MCIVCYTLFVIEFRETWYNRQRPVNIYFKGLEMFLKVFVMTSAFISSNPGLLLVVSEKEAVASSSSFNLTLNINVTKIYMFFIKYEN